MFMYIFILVFLLTDTKGLKIIDLLTCCYPAGKKQHVNKDQTFLQPRSGADVVAYAGVRME